MSRSRPIAFRNGAQEILVDAVCAERGRADDHFARALLDQRSGPLDRTHAAADARHRLRRDQLRTSSSFDAAAHGGIQVDHLNLRKGRELAQHLERSVRLQRLLAALHKLHDFAVHQVDAGNDHDVLPHRNAAPVELFFQLARRVYVP